SDQTHLRPTRPSRARGVARPRRPRAQGDPRYAVGVARRTCLVRGVLVVRRVAFAVPGDLATPTGGYAHDRRVIAELERLGWSVDLVDLGEGFPRPGKEQIEAARQRLMAIPAGCPVVVDGLALGVLPEAAARVSIDHPLIALVHHQLALES